MIQDRRKTEPIFQISKKVLIAAIDEKLEWAAYLKYFHL